MLAVTSFQWHLHSSFEKNNPKTTFFGRSPEMRRRFPIGSPRYGPSFAHRLRADFITNRPSRSKLVASSHRSAKVAIWGGPNRPKAQIFLVAGATKCYVLLLLFSSSAPNNPGPVAFCLSTIPDQGNSCQRPIPSPYLCGTHD